MATQTPLLETIVKGAGGKVMGPLNALFIGTYGAETLTAQANNPDSYKAKQADALVGLTTHVIATAASGIAAVGVASGPLAPITASAAALINITGLAVHYTAHRLNVEAHYNLGEIFNPSPDTKRHMIGLASQKFSKELADPATGKIDWGNMDTLNKYARLLTSHTHTLEEGLRKNDSYVPDEFRLWTESGRNAVDAQESRKSDLKIAQAAHEELRVQMDGVLLVRQYEKEAPAALAKLTGGAVRDLTAADLDRDGDGVFSDADAKNIRDTVGNKLVADVLFGMCREKNIHFKGERYVMGQAQEQLPPATANGMYAATNTTPAASPAPPAQSNSFFAAIAGFFTRIFADIASLFSPAKAPTQIASAAPAAQAAHTVTDTTGGLRPLLFGAATAKKSLGI